MLLLTDMCRLRKKLLETYTHISRETFSSVARELTDYLEVVELGLKTCQELLARRHQVRIQFKEVAYQLPQLLNTV